MNFYELSYEEKLKAVKENGLALAYVRNQTEEICLEAVKKDSYALFHVHNQTEEICLEAVKKDRRALEYVKEEELREKIKKITEEE